VTGNSHFRIASPKIISDVIDGEAILVNLASGDYYSLDPVGRDIWELMLAGLSAEAIADELARRYSGDSGEIRGSVGQFFHRLEAESLVVPGCDGVATGTEPAAHRADRPAFSPPALVKYTDMEDLLTLDPVHEVDDLGWPNAQRTDPSR
jgi:hypothetical protein